MQKYEIKSDNSSHIQDSTPAWVAMYVKKNIRPKLGGVLGANLWNIVVCSLQ